MEHINRSGSRRVCNDCSQEIRSNNGCGCPAVPFAKGDLVTLYAKADCPVGQAVIARIGNGTFRIKGTAHWYDIVTGNAHGDPKGLRTDFVRVVETGDEEAVAATRANLKAVTEWGAKKMRLRNERFSADMELRLATNRLTDCVAGVARLQQQVKAQEAQAKNYADRVTRWSADVARIDDELNAMGEACPL